MAGMQDDDDDFEEAMPRKSGGVLAQAAQKKRDKKKEGSGASSRAPKPTSVHVQSLGGAPSASVFVPTTQSLSGAAGKQSVSPHGPAVSTPPPQSARLGSSGSGPSALDALAPPSVAATPTMRAAKRKAPSTPTEGGSGSKQPTPKAPRTPKAAATPKKPPTPQSTPRGAGQGARAAESDAGALVAAHLLARNKPLNSQMISDGLLGDGHKVSKPLVEKQLATLVEAGTISAGEWGKAKLWWPNQERISATDDDEIDAKIAALQARLPAIKAAGLAKAKEVGERSRLPSFTLLGEHLADEERACEALRTRIAAREEKEKSGPNKSFTPAEAKKIRSQHEKLTKEWGRRKLMLREKLQEYCEASGKKMPALVEEIGIELDEDLGVDPTQFGVKCKWPQPKPGKK
ncbi:Tat binding protein 1-interacting protein-domain-containing protein [Pavlovales sp. CCMP2436]|nr:Tat binding protein 1-interacting protein-domain-containing protein [Pavlovales sp. CCMP2436]